MTGHMQKGYNYFWQFQKHTIYVKLLAFQNLEFIFSHYSLIILIVNKYGTTKVMSKRSFTWRAISLWRTTEKATVGKEVLTSSSGL